VGPYSGPLFLKANRRKRKDSLTIWFRKETSGGLKASDGMPLSHFEIAGKEGSWHPATATVIKGDRLVVTSEEVKQPVQARFAWNELAEPNLVNGAGLPASPFRTRSD
jgi:sialate O-acetylesterase